mgnify:CR=1 FL=1
MSDQAGDYGRAEIETHNNLLFQSKRLALLASFNPDIITIENDAGAPSALSLRRLTGTNTIQVANLPGPVTGVCMASEETKLNNQETNETNRPSGEQELPQPTSTSSSPQDMSAAAVSPAVDDDEEQRPSGDVDFGQLLDQFEQEQASLQEGEVVRGTVVGISERGVVIDFGYKSEGIVNPAEFTENGVLAVKAGDEVDVLGHVRRRDAVAQLHLAPRPADLRALQRRDQRPGQPRHPDQVEDRALAAGQRADGTWERFGGGTRYERVFVGSDDEIIRPQPFGDQLVVRTFLPEVAEIDHHRDVRGEDALSLGHERCRRAKRHHAQVECHRDRSRQQVCRYH